MSRAHNCFAFTGCCGVLSSWCGPDSGVYTALVPLPYLFSKAWHCTFIRGRLSPISFDSPLLICRSQMDETMEVDSGMNFQTLAQESQEFGDTQGTVVLHVTRTMLTNLSQISYTIACWPLTRQFSRYTGQSTYP